MENKLYHILTDRIHKEKMVAFLKKHPDLFVEVISFAFGNTKPQAWRATWLIGNCMILNDIRIKPYLNSMLKTLSKSEDGHQRELLKIFKKMELNDKQEGILFNSSIAIWEDIAKSSSVRIIAFSILVDITKKYSELLNEIKYLTQNHYSEPLTPGIRESFKRLKNELFRD